MMFGCPASSSLPPEPPVLWLSTQAAQLTVPIGDDSQRMPCGSGDSGGPSVLRLSTHSVELTVSIGDDGQLMSRGSGGPLILRLSTRAVQLTVPLDGDGRCMFCIHTVDGKNSIPRALIGTRIGGNGSYQPSGPP